jgi:hypothetical protein
MEPTWKRLCRLAVLALLSSGCSTTSANFCTESVVVPPSKYGTCTGFPDGGIVILSFPDLAGCEAANASSCTDQDRTIISNNINCENNAIKSMPDCEHGQELTWPGQWISMQCETNQSPSTACSQAVGLTSP